MKKLYIAGGHKCGSTTTFDLISTSSFVYSPPVKEPHGLSSDWMKNRLPQAQTASEYDAMYRNVDKSVSLDASVMYSHPNEIASVIEKISERDEEPFVLVCLRNPIQRAYSAWIEAFRDSPDESLAFSDAIDMDLAGDRAQSPVNTEYLLLGCLSHSIESFQNAGVPTSTIFLEDLIDSGAAAVEAALNSIGLNEVVGSMTSEVGHSNPGGKVWSSDRIGAIAGSRAAHKTASVLRGALPDNAYRSAKNLIADRLSTKAESMDSSDSERLGRYYAEEVDSLEALTKRNLDHWR